MVKSFPSGFYKWRDRGLSNRAKENQALTEHIRRIFDESRGIYGSPRVHAQLRREGVKVSGSRVKRLMRKAGLVAKASRVYRRQPLAKWLYESLTNLRLDRTAPTKKNEQWVGDVTYLKVEGEWRYLAVVMDLYSRRLIGWKLSNMNRTETMNDNAHMESFF